MLISGTVLQKQILARLANAVISTHITPSLEIIQVGANDASDIYVSNKIRVASRIGMRAHLNKFPDDVNESDLVDLIRKYNNDQETHGIMLQLPVPRHLNKRKILDEISPQKDVDGLTTTNQALLYFGTPGIVPCTPKGILAMIKSVTEDIAGKHAVVIGRSEIVGKPMASLLLLENCSVTVLHSKSTNLSHIASSADILISATGIPNLVDHTFVKPGAIVIDVGISRVEGHIVGDVNTHDVEQKAMAVSPVPGGVGPMTIAMLLENLLETTLKQSAS